MVIREAMRKEENKLTILWSPLPSALIPSPLALLYLSISPSMVLLIR
jgi:hypothetical protein